MFCHFTKIRIVLLFLLLAPSLSVSWQMQDTPRDIFAKVDHAMSLGDYDAAIDSLKNLVAKFPSNPEMRKRIAEAYLKTGDYRSAITEFSEAVRMRPSDFESALRCADLCAEIGEYGRARLIYKDVLKKGTDASKVSASGALRNIDSTLAVQIDRWTEALKESPGDYTIHEEIARLYEAKGEPGLAAEYFLSAWKLYPDLTALLLDLSRVLHELGRRTQERAALLVASYTGNTRTAVLAREKLYRHVASEQELRAALELAPGNEELLHQLKNPSSRKFPEFKEGELEPDAERENGSWKNALSCLNLDFGNRGGRDVIILRKGDVEPKRDLADIVRNGAFLILEGESKAASQFGLRPIGHKISVRNVQDLRDPEQRIIWERAVNVQVFKVPTNFQIFVRDRLSKAPLMAGSVYGKGAILWAAVSPGVQGYERFPFVLQTIVDLGLKPSLLSRRLWGFLDTSERLHSDPDYLADLWKKMGLSALHVGAWHFFESDSTNDEYLRKVIRACHERGLLVYAWLEFPHVSEKFWDQHPEWREKTALLQDAKLDWRKLMNLANKDCFTAVSKGTKDLLERFEWDGANLSELYFESFDGLSSPGRFTPLNDDVRHEFKNLNGFDPVELFNDSSSLHFSKNPNGLRSFLDYRVDLVFELQKRWIEEILSLRSKFPDFELILTQIDDRFNREVRDLVGADASLILKLMENHDFTFLVEDPFMVWNSSPQRYLEISKLYSALTSNIEKLAIDLNIVDLYGDEIYPTGKQVGVQLFTLVHLASQAFPRVALYAENTISKHDISLLPSASAVINRYEKEDGRILVDSPHGVGVYWEGEVLIDGKAWPATNGHCVWVPPGPHVIEGSFSSPYTRIVDFNGELKDASCLPNGVAFGYVSSSKAFVTLDKKPRRILLDRMEVVPRVLGSEGRFVLELPRGAHEVKVFTE
jgi:tetratricopeptide (TPR) repeat protein